MKRTSFKLHNDGVVRCTCGCVEDFAEDLYKYIVPIIDYSIHAEINYRQITVYTFDTIESICEKLMQTLRW